MNFSDISNITMSDSISGYMTPDEEDETGNTQYLSVLSDDMSFEGINITLANSQVNENDDTQVVEVTSEEQPLIFTFENSDEIFGLQLTRDEEGNLQKYQIQYSENVNGELVPMLETIQMLPLDDEEIEIDNSRNDGTLANENQDFEESMSNNEETTLLSNQHSNEVYLKQEINGSDENYEVFDKVNENRLSSSENISNNFSTYQAVSIKKEDNELLDARPNLKLVKDYCEEIEDEYVTQQLNLKIETMHETLVEMEEKHNSVLLENFEIENCVRQEEHEEVVDENIDNRQHFEQLFVEENHIIKNVELVENMNKNDSDNDMYHIVEGIHITGDIEDVDPFEEQVQSVLKESIEHHAKTNILKKVAQSSILKEPDSLEKVVYVQTLLEKENMEFMKIGSSTKPNARSLLKCNQPNPSQVTVVDPLHIETLEDKYSKRYSRTKEAKQARQFMNFINSTTIPQVPERKERLPRKQQIKPLKHLNEDIVVKEMIVSSNGFVEPISAEEKKYLPVMEYVELLDSGDESALPDIIKKRKKSSRKQGGLIEIDTTDSDESDVSVVELSIIDSSNNNKIKKKRGRRPKTKQVKDRKDSDTNIESPPKISRTENEVESVTSTLEVIQVENDIATNKLNEDLTNTVETQSGGEINGSLNGTSNNGIQNEVKYASQDVTENTKSQNCGVPNNDGSSKGISSSKPHNKWSTVRNGVQIPKLVPKLTLEYKYECDKCKSKFINNFLLSRHDCSMKAPLPFACDSCNKRFPNFTSLNVHKRVHTNRTLAVMKSGCTKIPFVANKAPVKKLDNVSKSNTKASVVNTKLTTCAAGSQAKTAQLAAPRSLLLPRQSTLPSRNHVKTNSRNPLRPSLSASNISQSEFVVPKICVQSAKDKATKPNILKIENQFDKKFNQLNSMSLTDQGLHKNLKTPDRSVEQKMIKRLAKPIIEHNGLGATPALTRNFSMLKSKFQ